MIIALYYLLELSVTKTLVASNPNFLVYYGYPVLALAAAQQHPACRATAEGGGLALGFKLAPAFSHHD